MTKPSKQPGDWLFGLCPRGAGEVTSGQRTSLASAGSWCSPGELGGRCAGCGVVVHNIRRENIWTIVAWRWNGNMPFTFALLNKKYWLLLPRFHTIIIQCFSRNLFHQCIWNLNSKIWIRFITCPQSVWNKWRQLFFIWYHYSFHSNFLPLQLQVFNDVY